jgi:hypothetical protein
VTAGFSLNYVNLMCLSFLTVWDISNFTGLGQKLSECHKIDVKVRVVTLMILKVLVRLSTPIVDMWQIVWYVLEEVTWRYSSDDESWKR